MGGDGDQPGSMVHFAKTRRCFSDRRRATVLNGYPLDITFDEDDGGVLVVPFNPGLEAVDGEDDTILTEDMVSRFYANAVAGGEGAGENFFDMVNCPHNYAAWRACEKESIGVISNDLLRLEPDHIAGFKVFGVDHGGS